MRFDVYGPYDVPTTSDRKIDFDNVKNIFDAANKDSQRRGQFDVSTSIGCYVFCLSPSGGPRIVPYYVGQACRQTLKIRSFQRTDKPYIYNDIMGEYEKAAPKIFLLPLLTELGNPARLRSHSAIINDAEYLLIGLAKRINSDLWNINHKIAMDRFSIKSIHNHTGQPTNASASLKSVLGL